MKTTETTPSFSGLCSPRAREAEDMGGRHDLSGSYQVRSKPAPLKDARFHSGIQYPVDSQVRSAKENTPYLAGLTPQTPLSIHPGLIPHHPYPLFSVFFHPSEGRKKLNGK